ncbi:MAG: alpha/beta hydrolase [Muribaculaceae bacterium]|nr:alpha/beta hydrolase [Muribaculaceae bacterium]
MRKLPFLMLALLAAFVAMAVDNDNPATWRFPEKYTGPKTPTTDTTWHPDILKGYEARYVNQGEAFDGPCRCTIVRKLCGRDSHKAFLYVHGFNDYFFQSEMGQLFVDSGYNFYAVDLRRYGRSWEPWQWPFNVRDQKEYFKDIDAALEQIRRDGNTDITLGGHSTGGLTVALFGAIRGKDITVNRIVTDSPFLAWNFNPFMRKIAIPVVGFFGSVLKNTKIKQGHCDGYAYSLLKEYHGEWEYNTDWKMVYSPPVTMSWVRAISRAQGDVLRHKKDISVPILVMHSSRKIDGCNWTPAFQTGDAVLDPEQIQKRGVQLGHDRQVCTIDSGLHDLILSRPEVRRAAYDTIFAFIRRHL